jgi:phosphoribosylglycinamide formyltransferase-1
LDYGVKITGCTVHLVDSGIDTGKIIAQSFVEILEDDTEDSLHARIKEAEKGLYPKVLRDLIKGEISK